MTPAERLQLELAETFGPLPGDAAVREAAGAAAEAAARAGLQSFLAELAGWADTAKFEDVRAAWVIVNREVEMRLDRGEV